jgi:tetratricopeptide (TPR) repeat protein
MRINRQSSQLNFRRRRRSGCISPTLLLGVLVGGLVTLSWNWFGQWFQSGSALPAASTSLRSAEAAFNRGDLDQAVALTEQILAEQPDDPAALLLLTRALIYRSYSDYDRETDRAAALRLTEAAAERLTTNDDVQTAYAFALQAAGQPVSAAQIAAKVLERSPDHALARMALALGYSGVGSHEVALRESQRAVASPGWRMDTHRALALSYSGVGDYRSAIQSVERAIRLNDRMIPLYFERALYARQIGDADAASVAYFRVLAIDPGNVKARFRLCELSSVLRERESAITFCREVTELAPAWSDGWYQLGREYFLQGNFEQARDHLNRCATLQTEQDVPIEQRRFECWYLQGQAAEILGDCATLVATYNEYRLMARTAGLTQTWLYPPEGPPLCAASRSGG